MSDQTKVQNHVDSLDVLFGLTNCKCAPYYADRNVQDPDCRCDYREDVETVQVQILNLKAEVDRLADARVVAELRVAELEDLILDCNTTAYARGDLGVCDCIDNTGKPYQSAHLANVIAAIAATGKGENNG